MRDTLTASLPQKRKGYHAVQLQDDPVARCPRQLPEHDYVDAPEASRQHQDHRALPAEQCRASSVPELRQAHQASQGVPHVL